MGAILVLVTAAVAAVGFAHDARQRELARTDMRRTALRSLTSGMDAVTGRTHQAAALFSASEHVTKAEFHRFTQPLLRDGSASAFGWVPFVRHADRARWEHENGAPIRDIGARGPAPAPNRASYYPMLLLESLVGARVPRGLDLAADPVHRRTMRAAAASGEPRATPVIVLVGSERPGMVVYAPVYRADGRRIGGAVGSFRIEQLVRTMAGVLPHGAAFELLQDGRRVGGHGRIAAGADHWAVDLAGQRLVLATSPPPQGRLGNGIIALIVGGLLTAVVVLTLSHLAREAGRAQREASKSEERFAQAFDHAPVGMALLDSAGRHVKVNEAMASMLGRTREELTGLGPDDVMPPTEAAACHRLVAALVRGDQSSFSGDSLLLTADERRVRVSVHMTLLGQAASGDAPILVHAVDVTEQRLAESRMKHLVDHDPLTGLLNRRGFSAALQRQIAHVRRHGPAGALLILDLDGFKRVNDAHGHDAGDRLLVQVSEELRASLRETDVVARLGGDEFAAILPGETLDDAAIVAARITQRVRERCLGPVGSAPSCVTISIGVASFDGGHETGQDILREADLAMYSAKAAGRDRHAVHGRLADIV